MAARFPELSDRFIEFIQAQQLYFVGTAAAEGTVNVSPKGGDSLRVLSPNRILWLNVTGSGNETAAHLRLTDRMTLMFCSFTEQPMIMRCYGKAKALHERDADWDDYVGLFPPNRTARQLVLFDIDRVQTSCGFGVPFYDYGGERDNMEKYWGKRDRTDVENYWAEKNQTSLDGFPTGILGDDE
jgi:hypothetical protein